ncbi:MAG: hypothetical protein COU31_00230, partial [Candidatus Magasanikbacteria bacterium CG10_big_fil_rev_8_21_14_0_10_40_10]
EEVKQLQIKLKELGYFDYPEATGFFGDITKRALIKFQQANIDKLGSTPGWMGPGTMNLLNSLNLSDAVQTTQPSALAPNNTTGQSAPPANASHKPLYIFTNYLYLGDQGEEVKQLQIKLKELGY